MTTTKKRVNISISKDADKILSTLAKRDQVPQATKIAHLVQIAIESEEDQILDEIVSERDKKNSKFLSHKQAWI
ncbi:MAG: hypothetical protein WC849_02060 [Candidatus Paceibacterota bacterium]